MQRWVKSPHKLLQNPREEFAQRYEHDNPTMVEDSDLGMWLLKVVITELEQIALERKLGRRFQRLLQNYKKQQVHLTNF